MDITAKPATARVFFALWPSAPARMALYQLALRQRPRCKGRVTHADNLHLTLLFLGDVQRTHLPQLMQAASKVSAPPFAFVLQTFTGWKHNRIAYAAPAEDVPALTQLAAALRQQLNEAGFRFNSEKFTPHVTLLRQVAHLLPLQAITPISWAADSFVLVESVSAPQGVRYQILHQWPLGNTAEGE